MLGDPTFSDVAFVVQHVDQQGVETTSVPIAAHKALLAARRRGRSYAFFFFNVHRAPRRFTCRHLYSTAMIGSLASSRHSSPHHRIAAEQSHIMFAPVGSD